MTNEIYLLLNFNCLFAAFLIAIIITFSIKELRNNEVSLKYAFCIFLSFFATFYLSIYAIIL